jgi:hypothetical protein
MRKAILVLGVVTMLGASAYAQDAPPVKYTVQLGFTQLNSKTARDATKSSGTLLGLGYVLPTKMVNSQVSADLLMGSNSGKGNKLETSGIYYTVRMRANPTSEGTTQFYYGGALGLVQTKFRYQTTLSGNEPTTTSASKSSSGIGLRLLAGAQLQGGFMVELGYNIAPRVSVGATRVDPNSLSFSVGKGF